MATIEEIEQRIDQNDTARTAKRTAAATQIGELARQYAAVLGQLHDIERQLGDILVDTTDVLGIDELARFTDVPAADLTRWFTGRKTVRTKRKRRPQSIRTARSRTPADNSPPAAPDTADST